MSAKNKIISLRVEEDLYNELEKQAEAEGENISNIVREMIYAFVYSQSKYRELNKVITVKGENIKEFINEVEGRRELINKSLLSSRDYIEQLENMNSLFEDVMKSLEEQVKRGAHKISDLKVKG
ncbi:ribbon-helix-helix protein, CopG family [uncultured Methanobrevibacter sp.]|jgi:negative regulator of replication initiation|uniref:ribbon-helix-helix protein, CopG family n=1 Tax=uncultured Methanobrevibacter sp. TaxID=253161 RepID=UPI0026197D14|nr:ribbon-helix-helix protein, CopG family [uncultured Methanobrevibacter sp.]